MPAPRGDASRTWRCVICLMLSHCVVHWTNFVRHIHRLLTNLFTSIRSMSLELSQPSKVDSFGFLCFIRDCGSGIADTVRPVGSEVAIAQHFNDRTHTYTLVAGLRWDHIQIVVNPDILNFVYNRCSQHADFWFCLLSIRHYNDVIMGTITSKITSLASVYSVV